MATVASSSLSCAGRWFQRSLAGYMWALALSTRSTQQRHLYLLTELEHIPVSKINVLGHCLGGLDACDSGWECWLT